MYTSISGLEPSGCATFAPFVYVACVGCGWTKNESIVTNSPDTLLHCYILLCNWTVDWSIDYGLQLQGH